MHADMIRLKIIIYVLVLILEFQKIIDIEHRNMIHLNKLIGGTNNMEENQENQEVREEEPQDFESEVIDQNYLTDCFDLQPLDFDL